MLQTNGNSSVYLSNNIFWNNSGRDLAANGLTLVHNIVQTLAGTPNANSSGNLSIDPGFSSATDFRLQANSAAVNSGANAAFGGLASRDLAGVDRLIGSFVDRGAYESDNEFRDGFE